MGTQERGEAHGEPLVQAPEGGDVVGGLHLGVGAGEIQVHGAVLYRHPYSEANGNAADQIVVQIVPKVVDAVAETFKNRPRLGLGIIQELVLTGEKGRDPMPFDDVLDPLAARVERRQHGPDIAHVFFGDARVGLEDVDEVLVHHPLSHELHGRDAQPFLEYLVERGGDGGRHRPADVGGMDEAPAVGDNAPVVKIGLDDRDIRAVGGHAARKIGVVGDDDVARLQIGNRRQRGRGVQVDKQGDARGPGVSEDAPVQSDQGAGVVGGLLDEERPRRALQRARHHLGGGNNLVGEYLKLNWAESHDWAPQGPSVAEPWRGPVTSPREIRSAAISSQTTARSSAMVALNSGEVKWAKVLWRKSP